MSKRIGFIGQGYVGKNYADDFENRGYDIVRYSLEELYRQNKDTVGKCDIIFIAVPTPSTPKGFDATILEQVLQLVAPGKIVVIKSTILPGSTKKLQEQFKDLVLLFSPEFLREATALHDAAHPFSIIVGMSIDNQAHRTAADDVMGVLPDAPFKHICSSTEAELVKYAQNSVGYAEIVMFNIFYDLAQKLGADWEQIRVALAADPDIASRFANPVHKSGRGAGGHCLIKDFAAVRELYEKLMPEDIRTNSMLTAIEQKNVSLLVESKKDLDLVEGVYGPQLIRSTN